MKVPLSWLKDYVEISMRAEELADLLTGSGTEVAALLRPGEGAKGILAARVLDVRPHPGADRLSLCEVEWGSGRDVVVCGAPNVVKGMLAPLVRPGSVLPGGMKVREARIRGELSRGMLCSGAELGLNDDASGILELGEEFAPGDDLVEALGMAEPVLDLEITPNRPDCLSVVGIAREVAVLTGQALRQPSFRLREEGDPAEEEFAVEILDPDLCPRYVARLIEMVDIRPAPLWMQYRLKLAGLRPISNVVDITNYVMLETGQPLHAFDADKIKEGRVLVRRAGDGEEMVTLDGVVRRLRSSSLLICDPAGPIALAGVMGGLESEVTEGTRRILLESAHFNPSSILRTAREQELPSEAAYRFERGVDPGGCLYAADRAASLMQELAGGSVRRGAIDVVPQPINPVSMRLRLPRARRLLGVELEAEWVGGVLRMLGCEVEAVQEDQMEVKAPTFRPDLEREIDLVEELARVYGYSNIPSTLPSRRARGGGLNRPQRKLREARALLTGMGLNEAISYSFVSGHDNRRFTPEGGGAVLIANPLSEEQAEMRRSLLPGLLSTLAYNHRRHQEDLGIFEMGRVFHPVEGRKQPREELWLGIALMGDWIPRQWDRPAEAADFFTLKGIWEGLLEGLHFRGPSMRPLRREYLYPRRAAELLVDGVPVGEMGELHPMTLKERDLPQGITVLQANLDTLLRLQHGTAEYVEIPRYPAVQMDLSVLAPMGLEVGEMLRIIRESGGELLKEVRLFDLYRGKGVPEGTRSLTFGLTFYDLQRTLKDEEAKRSFAAIVERLQEEAGVRIRA
jgi:phenylalanyl-tRNA synthetase beta chain